MNESQSPEWAQSFENMSVSELRAMSAPLGLSGGGIMGWWDARERAIAALEVGDAQAVSSENVEMIELSGDDGVVANDDDEALEELALTREEEAQQREVVGRSSMFSDPAPVLDEIAPAFARPKARVVRGDGDTEHLLNGLIAECHLLMRAVTLPSAMRAADADTRRDFLNSAMNIAKTGAKIGRAVARLRGAGAANSFHQKVTVEHAARMGRGSLPQNGAKT